MLRNILRVDILRSILNSKGLTFNIFVINNQSFLSKVTRVNYKKNYSCILNQNYFYSILHYNVIKVIIIEMLTDIDHVCYYFLFFRDKLVNSKMLFST